MIEIPTEYLDITHAITFAGTCTDWEELRGFVDRGFPLNKVIETYVETIEETIEEGSVIKIEELLKTKEQLQTPEFRTYLSAKLGMM